MKDEDGWRSRIEQSSGPRWELLAPRSPAKALRLLAVRSATSTLGGQRGLNLPVDAPVDTPAVAASFSPLTGNKVSADRNVLVSVISQKE